jgi:hypothetical protein
LQLHEVLLSERAFELANEVLGSNNLEQAMVKLDKTIPCLLHLDNCSSEALIAHLFHRGILLHEDCAEATSQLIMDLELIINQELFGSPRCPSNWKFPLNTDETMAEIKFANWWARRIVEHSNSFVDCCLWDEEERNKWKICFAHYHTTIKVCEF